MITFFRRMLNSKVGVVLALIFLGVIALGFAAMDVQNLGLGGGAGTSSSGPVAEVAGEDVTAAELQARIDQEWRTERQNNPTLDRAAFVAGGGLDRTLDRIVNGLSLEAFARKHGMAASERLVEGRIASIPGFQGPSGRFDEATFRRVLAQERISEAQIRADIARETLVSQLMQPIIGAAQVPQQVALPYANLLLERRAGAFALVPAAAMPAGAAPNAQEIEALYRRRIDLFTVPERRSIAYATFTSDKVADRARPSAAEVSQFYASNRARFAARQTRDLAQVIVLDQATATRIAQQVRGGTALAAAATAAGLEATTLADVEKAALAAQSSAAVADAAFAAAEGSVAGPVRSPLGWHVLRVEDVSEIAGRSLDQAREEITAELARTRGEAAMADLVASIEDAAADGASVAEIARKFGLSLATSPAITAQGRNPAQPDQPPAPVLGAIIRPAFEAEPGDDPQVSALPQDAGYILWDLDSVVQATPTPLAEVRDQVSRLVVAERQANAARALARQIVAKVNRGTPLERALAEAGVRGEIERVNGTRAQLTGGQRAQVSPPIALLLSMAPGSAKQLDAPGGQGTLVVRLDSAQAGDARRQPQVLAQTRAGVARVIGQEYAEQFVKAVRAEMKASTNAAAIAAARRQVTGGQ